MHSVLGAQLLQPLAPRSPCRCKRLMHVTNYRLTVQVDLVSHKHVLADHRLAVHARPLPDCRTGQGAAAGRGSG